MAGTPKCWYCDSEFGEPEVIWNQLKPDYPENWKPLYAAPVDATAEIARLRGALEEINRITFDDDANRIAHLALNP